MKHYARFAAMIGTSTIVMFGLMYLNTYQLDHVFFSETRTYMALIVGATMAVIMLTFMLSMHPSRGIISGPRVRELADQIIRSQREEIAEMKNLIRDLESRE